MSDAVLGAFISAIIGGVFSLIGKRMELRQRSAVGAPTDSGTAGAVTRPPAGVINYGQALTHIGILQLIVNLVGFVVGQSVGPTNPGAVFPLILVLGTVVASAFFYWASLRVDRAVRWRQMSIVAVGTAITTVVINSIFLQIQLSLGVFMTLLLFALVQTFVCMGIGVGLANRAGR